jgi:hypothetical protein
MIYLSGTVLRPHPEGVGVMLTPQMGNKLPDDTWWAADNGCFSNPESFNWGIYKRFLDKRLATHGEKCLFVTAPDVPFDMDGTLQRFELYRDRLMDIQAPIALVTQDGMGIEDVPWNDISALFVGGSTEWKLGHESATLMMEARRRGHWVHVGRVNSLRRLQAAASCGAQSADGTYLKYGPDVNLPKLRGWLDTQAREKPMVIA